MWSGHFWEAIPECDDGITFCPRIRGWRNRTVIGHEPLMCSKMCFAKTELVQKKFHWICDVWSMMLTAVEAGLVDVWWWSETVSECLRMRLLFLLVACFTSTKAQTFSTARIGQSSPLVRWLAQGRNSEVPQSLPIKLWSEQLDILAYLWTCWPFYSITAVLLENQAWMYIDTSIY